MYWDHSTDASVRLSNGYQSIDASVYLSVGSVHNEWTSVAGTGMIQRGAAIRFELARI